MNFPRYCFVNPRWGKILMEFGAWSLVLVTWCLGFPRRGKATPQNREELMYLYFNSIMKDFAWYLI